MDHVMYHVCEMLSQHIKCQCCPQVETSQLISCANQLTGFYIRDTLALKGLTSSKNLGTVFKLSDCRSIKAIKTWKTKQCLRQLCKKYTE